MRGSGRRGASWVGVGELECVSVGSGSWERESWGRWTGERREVGEETRAIGSGKDRVGGDGFAGGVLGRVGVGVYCFVLFRAH